MKDRGSCGEAQGVAWGLGLWDPSPQSFLGVWGERAKGGGDEVSVWLCLWAGLFLAPSLPHLRFTSSQVSSLARGPSTTVVGTPAPHSAAQ